MKAARLAVERDSLAARRGELVYQRSPERVPPVPETVSSPDDLSPRPLSAPAVRAEEGLTVLVLPTRVAPLLQDRLAPTLQLTIVALDALHPGQIPVADLCIVHESYGTDTASVVRDLAERVGLGVVAVGERSPSSAGALRYIHEGADDYLSTGATSAEWVARVRAVVRRRAPVPAGPTAVELRAGDLMISLAQRQVWRDGTPVKLTHTEFSLLENLAQYIDTPVAYTRLIAGVWGVEHLKARHYLRVYIRRLREKLEADPTHPRLITTEWRAGYMLRSGGAPPQTQQPAGTRGGRRR